MTFSACLHYNLVTQITVGYGDILTITIFGRIFSIICIIFGLTSTTLQLIFIFNFM
jgi:hypothetical protein